MDKITFENATLVSPAKVTIDNVDYNVTPEQTTGGTALSAGTFNQMQSNIEKSAVFVGEEQPTTNEKVWFKKGKNLFDSKVTQIWNTSYNNGTIVFGNDYVQGQDIKFSTSKYNKNLEYTISFDAISDIAGAEIVVDGQPDEATSSSHFGDEVFTITTTSQRYSVSGTLDNDITEFRFYRTTSMAEGTTATITISNIQIEYGSATSYEPYMNKKILVKNGSNVFEEFYNEEKKNPQVILGSGSIDTNLTSFNISNIDFNLYQFIVVQVGSSSEGDSKVFLISDNGNFVNDIAHLDMYANSSYRCRTFASLHITSGTIGYITISPKQLTGWGSVIVTIKGILK